MRLLFLSALVSSLLSLSVSPLAINVSQCVRALVSTLVTAARGAHEARAPASRRRRGARRPPRARPLPVRCPSRADAGRAVRRAPVLSPVRSPVRSPVQPSRPTRARRRTPTWARRATRPSSVRPFACSFVRSFARSPVRPFCARGRTRAVSVGREQQERQEAAQSRVRSVGGTPVELEAVGRGRKSPPGAPRSHGAHRGGAAGWERLRDGIAW